MTTWQEVSADARADLAHPESSPLLRPRRIIERPRLISALDRSQASLRMLVAGAGYGKTTLAEQWAAQDRSVAWVRAGRSSTDVAVLARQMAAACAEIVADCDRRLIERLNATRDPADELEVLVDLLSEGLAPWPDDAWLIIDDYHHLKESATAEAFVEGLLRRTPVRVLIASRDRPSWVSMRSVLYGEVLEIGQSMLAMSEEEADDLLAGAHEGMSPGLLAIAGGWPALVGLASLTTTESPLPDEGLDMPQQLYEFFADEVYRGLDPDSRVGLGLLATAPSLDRELAAELLGPERAARVCAEALSIGVLEERDGKLELHPLASVFLEERARRETDEEFGDAVDKCLAVYCKRFEWDAACELVNRYGTDENFANLFAAGLDDLLDSARLATIAAWIERANSRQISTSAIDVAKAEIALRDGRHLSAQTLAQAALATAENEQSDPWRAAIVAGRAAHAGSREESALEFYRIAERFADSPEKKRGALWGQLMCASALESPTAYELLDVLEATSDPGDQYELIRMADKKLGMDFRFGSIRHLTNARQAAELIGYIADPFVRCSFRCAFSYALNLSAFYGEAHEQASLLFEDASSYRIDLALPYAHTMLAMALAGLGRPVDANRALEEALRQCKRCNDDFGRQSVFASKMRTLVQEGRANEACAIEPPDLAGSLKSMKGEVLASRGLALATSGRLADARAHGQQARETTGAVEAKVLAAAIEAVCGVKERTSGTKRAVEALIDTAFDAGAVDFVVTAYRGNADLLVELLSSSVARERTMYVVARAGDSALLSALGWESAALSDPIETLSRREREVYNLMCDGLSNGEIAKLLFITEGTVKVHVQHVFDKVGIRSRTALAINAARDRWRHAAPTSLGDADSDATGLAAPSNKPASST